MALERTIEGERQAHGWVDGCGDVHTIASERATTTTKYQRCMPDGIVLLMRLGAYARCIMWVHMCVFK